MEEQKSRAQVTVDETLYVKFLRIINAWDLKIHGLYTQHRITQIDIVKEVSGVTHKVSFFGLWKRDVHWRKEIILGRISHDKDDYICFYCHGEFYLPFVKILADELARVSGKSIHVCLDRLDSEKVENWQPDDLSLLNTRRRFLEKEQQRIDSELVEVHKKLQTLEGGGSPYRVLGAVE